MIYVDHAFALYIYVAGFIALTAGFTLLTMAKLDRDLPSGEGFN